MNLELNKSTGNLFINKSEFFFNNEQFISNNIFLKKHHHFYHSPGTVYE